MFDLMVPRRSRRSTVPALRDVRNVDALFDDLWRGFKVAPAAVLPGFRPSMDVRETDEEIVLTAELPGLEEGDFEVSLEEDVLTLKGEKKTEHTEESEGYRHVETRRGSFERRFRIPVAVDPEQVNAAFRNGVLTITLPKPEEARPQVRSIPISSS